VLARHEAKRFPARPITTEHPLAVEQPPPHHRGPFDRMLVAQATVETLTIGSADPQLRSRAVPLILGQPPGVGAGCGWIDTGGIDRAPAPRPGRAAVGGARAEPPSPRARRTRKTVSDQAAAGAAAAAA
jgi:hypothetical protein